MTNPEPTTSRRRFRPRLSLRALMLLVLIVGGGTGWWKAAHDRGEHRRKILTTLTSIGVSCIFDDPEIGQFLGPNHPPRPSSVPTARLNADQIRALSQYQQLRQWTMPWTAVDDEVVATIARSPDLEQFHSSCPEVTDDGLIPLTRLDHLRSLQLIQTSRLTDASLVHVGRLGHLQFLTITAADLQGPGTARLADLSALQFLAIPNTGVGDGGLAAIGRLSRLGTLDVGGGTYTDAGLARLTRLAQLTSLTIGSPDITAAGLDHLSAMKRLKALTLSGTINDDWLDRLAERGPASLRKIDLNGVVGVSEGAIERMHRTRPKITIHINGKLP